MNHEFRKVTYTLPHKEWINQKDLLYGTQSLLLWWFIWEKNLCVCVFKGCSPFVVTVKPWFYSLRCTVPPSSLFILCIVVGRKGLEDTLWYTLVNTQSSSLIACRSYACDTLVLRIYFLKQLEHVCVPQSFRPVISGPLLFRWCSGKSQCQRRYSATKALLSRAETEAAFCFFSNRS